MINITYIENTNIQQALSDGLNINAKLVKGLIPMKPFSIAAYNDTLFIGGITGHMYYGCCAIDSLWVSAQNRKKGIGKNLLFQVEEKAMLQENLFISVRTMDFEARDFYVKLGYNIEFIHRGFIKDSTMYFLRKNLYST
jgi:ribosomal protein S18 acetylase RimI-like enzyme